MSRSLTEIMDENELELVKSTALLGGLRDELLILLLRDSRVQKVTSGELLFMHGTPVEACYIVLDGWIKLFRLTPFGDEAIVSIFARGQSFAEAAVFSMGDYPVSAEAVTNGKLLRILSSTLLQSVRGTPEIALSMLVSTSHHLHELVRQTEQLKTKSGVQRVARFLR